MKYIFVSILLSVVCLASYAAQDKDTCYWKTGGVFALNASQVSLTNWSAGGENSISGNAYVNLFANYKKNKSNWDNTLDLGYGKMRQGKKDKVIYYKTDDKIDFASKYGQYAFKNWFYSALVSFKTQFDEGFKSVSENKRISNFMAPAYINLSIGMDYKYKDKLTVFMSPFSGRITMVLDTLLANSGAYGVTRENHVRKEFGGHLKVQYKVDITKTLAYTSKLDLFSNYLDKPQNIDVSWENFINLKISNYFSANLNFNLLYDDNIKFAYDSDGDGINDKSGPKLQIKELFGIGITYKF